MYIKINIYPKYKVFVTLAYIKISDGSRDADLLLKKHFFNYYYYYQYLKQSSVFVFRIL